jgi:RecJ-like exonuclease
MRTPRSKEIPRPLCGCGELVIRKGYTQKGFPIWATGCAKCRYAGRKHKKDYCETCGGTNNLGIDHVDGNRANNNPINLKTLCDKCHNKKTTENNERVKVKYSEVL